MTQIRVGHVSMQFGDTKEQKEEDAASIFERAYLRDYRWIVGTEAGGRQGPATRAALREQCKLHGYRFLHKGGDMWMAVQKMTINGSWDAEWHEVIPAAPRHYAAKGVLRATFNTVWGQTTLLGSHFLLRNNPRNYQLANRIGILARRYGKGRALVFYSGDQNMQDRKFDTFLGQPLTSAADETGRHYNTGHGSIDVIASYDRDRRVKCVKWRVFDDDKFPLHTDHYLCEAMYEIGTGPSSA
jgi:hypothetical protein